MVLSLVRGGGLSGHVKNPAGEVVSNPAVRIRRRDRDDGGGGPWFRANVGPDGHYSFGALRPGLYRLEAFAKGLAGTCPALNIQAATDTRLDVHLTVGGGIRVKVTDPDGRPGQAWISIEPLDAGLPVAENWQGTRRQTDARGNLHRVGLAPGQYRVQASSKRWVKAEEVITVSAGVDLHLPLQLTRGGSLRVTAIGPDRCPIEGVAMRMKRDGKVVLPDSAHLYTLFADSLKKNAGLNWPDFRRSFFQTGSGGTLLCSCIQPGNYVVEASKEGFKKTTSRVTILDNHESRLRLTLRQE